MGPLLLPLLLLLQLAPTCVAFHVMLCSDTLFQAAVCQLISML
jgi:hypothetical protein